MGSSGSSNRFFGWWVGGRGGGFALQRYRRLEFLATGRRGRTSKIDDKEMDLRPESRGRELAGLACARAWEAGIRQEQGLFFVLERRKSLIRQYGNTYWRCGGGYVLAGPGEGAGKA